MSRTPTTPAKAAPPIGQPAAGTEAEEDDAEEQEASPIVAEDAAEEQEASPIVQEPALTAEASRSDPGTAAADDESDRAEDVVAEPIGVSIFTSATPTTWGSTLRAIMSSAVSAGSSLATALREDPIGFAQRSSAALMKALTTGEMKAIPAKTDGPAIEYPSPSVSDASLKCERSGDENKFNFNPNGKFTGVLIVQRIGKDGKLDPNNVDTVIFEEGKVASVLPGNDLLGECRIGNMQELQAQQIATERTVRAGSEQTRQTAEQLQLTPRSLTGSAAPGALSDQETAGRAQVQAEYDSSLSALSFLAQQKLQALTLAQQELQKAKATEQRKQAAASRANVIRLTGELERAKANFDYLQTLIAARVQGARGLLPLSSRDPSQATDAPGIQTDPAKAASDEQHPPPIGAAMDEAAQAKAEEVRLAAELKRVETDRAALIATFKAGKQRILGIRAFPPRSAEARGTPDIQPDAAKAASAEGRVPPIGTGMDEAAPAKTIEDVQHDLDLVATRLEPLAEGQPPLTSRELEELAANSIKNARTINAAISQLNKDQSDLRRRMDAAADEEKKAEPDTEAKKKSKEIADLIAENAGAISRWNKLKKQREAVQDKLSASLKQAKVLAAASRRGTLPTHTPPLTPRGEGAGNSPVIVGRP